MGTRGRSASIRTTTRWRPSLAMAVLLLIYVNLCVRSFIEARRARQG